MTDTKQIIRVLAASFEAAYNPVGHAHGNMREDKYISISALVAKPAATIYDEVMGDDDDDVPKYYTFRGDALAEAVVRGAREAGVELEDIVRVEHWMEPGIHVPMGDGWYMRGHSDDIIRIFLKDGRVLTCAMEHKSHRWATGTNYTKAMRQAMLYLWSYMTGSGRYESAKWATEHFILDRLANEQPLCIFVCIADDGNARGRVGSHPVTLADLEEVGNYYMEKADALKTAFLGGDRGAAEAWDKEHLDEFTGTTYESDAEKEKLCARYNEVTEAISDLHQEKKELETVMGHALFEHDDAWEGDDWVASISTVSGRRSVKVNDVLTLSKKIEDPEVKGKVEGLIYKTKPFKKYSVSRRE